MNRRKFAQSLAVGFALISFPACLFSNIYKTINQYVPLALLAFERIISILAEHGISVSGLQDAVNAVKAALADIQSAILEYQEANSHGKPTGIQIIVTALNVAHGRLEEFWRKLNIPNPQLSFTIKSLLGIIISTLQGFEQQLPAHQQGPGPMHTSTFTGAGKVRTIKEFREEFNEELREHDESKFAI